MKEVKAYIKPHKLSDVTLALQKLKGLTGMSVVDMRGFGRGRGEKSYCIRVWRRARRRWRGKFLRGVA